MVLIPFLNHSCLSAVVPIVPSVVTMIVNNLQLIHQLSQLNILAIGLSLMLLRLGMNTLMMCAEQHQLPPSGKSSKLALKTAVKLTFVIYLSLEFSPINVCHYFVFSITHVAWLKKFTERSL